MSTPSNETEKRESGTSMRPTSGPRRYKKLLIIAGILVAICALGLGLGVGLGLGLRAKSSVSNSSTLTTSDGSSSTSTLSGSVPAHTGSSWQPAVNDSFNYQLSVVPISSNPYGISIWFIDLFAATKDVIKGLQDNGAKVVCYFSAGSSENWRSDFQQFQASDLGNNLRGWEGERWLNTNSNTVRAIMKARMDQAVAKGCDGIDPDNMDAYDNEGGGSELNLTPDDATQYAKFLASEASTRSLSIGLKNAATIIPAVIGVMQWSVNEQCFQLHECESYATFIAAGKPVFNIEYPKGDTRNDSEPVDASQLSGLCDQVQNKDMGFSTILKNMNLDAWIGFCNGTFAVLT